MADLLNSFNSEEYGYKDIQVVMLGRPIIGLRGIKYSVRQEKSNVYGAGKKPIARSRGNIVYEGAEIKVLMSELRALLQSQGNPAKGVVAIAPFDVIVAYAPENGGVVTTDILKYVEFTESMIDVNQGDQQIEVTLPIVIGDIEFNV